MYKLSFSVLLTCVAILSGCDDGSPTKPVGELRTDIRGYKSGPDVLMSALYEPTWVQYAVNEYQRHSASEQPAKVEMVSRPKACKFASPKTGSAIKYVALEHSDIRSSIVAASKQDLEVAADRALEAISRLKPGEKSAPAIESAAKYVDEFGVVDVIIGKSEEPVYLVLLSSSNTVWNLMVAPGTQLDHVAVLGNRKSAIANLPDNVSYEFLDGEKLKTCDVMPIREPQPEWRLVERAKTMASVNDALNKNYKMFNTYKNWLQGQFGLLDDMERISTNRASHFLVGSIPAKAEEKPVYKPLTEAKLIMPETMLVSHEGKEAFREQFARLINQRALEKDGKI